MDVPINFMTRFLFGCNLYEKYTAVREIKTMQNEKLKVPWTGL